MIFGVPFVGQVQRYLFLRICWRIVEVFFQCHRGWFRGLSLVCGNTLAFVLTNGGACLKIYKVLPKIGFRWFLFAPNPKNGLGCSFGLQNRGCKLARASLSWPGKAFV